MSYDWRKHKFRSHYAGDLMTGLTKAQLTDNQKITLKEYQARDNGEGKPLTDNQKKELEKLVKKRDTPPELSDTVTSKLQELYFEFQHGKKTEISTKFTDKGLETEPQSITLLSEFYGKPYFKNKLRKENDLLTGLPDIDDKKLKKIIDIKASWNHKTFPLFKKKLPTKLYWWQVQCYMWLWGYDVAEVVYVLVDTPEHLIFDEIRREAWKQNIIDPSEEFEEEIRNNLTYSDLPIDDRIKRFTVERDESAIKQLKQRLIECRGFLVKAA